MEVIQSISDLREKLESHRNNGKSIGLVPTMGSLHQGHAKLVKSATEENSITVTTIFVNPLQFNPGEDFENYPRTLNEDIEILENLNCDYLFCPKNDEIIEGKSGDQALIKAPQISRILCGKSRPGHFDGVATIICVLFNIICPTTAYFGLKDYQQYLIIKKLVSDFRIPVGIKGIETARDKNGLALSSRNVFFSSKELKIASQLFLSINEISNALHAGNKNFKILEDKAKGQLSRAGFLPDYCSICHANTLNPADSNDKDLVILVAAHLGSVRLIDNLRVFLDH